MEALRASRAALAATSLVALASCAPSMQQLVEHRHYREAICATSKGPPSDDDLLRDALRRDLGAQVHARVLDLPIDANDAANGEPHVRVLKLRVATNALPVDQLSVRVSGKAGGLVSADLDSLAAITHEHLPGSRDVSPGIGEGLIIGILAVATVGLVRIQPSPTRTEYPSETELRRAAPRAYALAERLRSSCEQPAADGVALRCSYAFVVPSNARTAHDPVTLELAFRMETHPATNEACVFTETARLNLGTPDSLAQAVATTYPRFRPLREVAMSTR